ncbi:OLC1v1035813C1 [Oldenlandia corymbosa var. corymbosa]|uniref:OLC1v1035813C1 n=1 Tax=Oldenlandia corymbosa var. corymbosa TaxID=529605 RepID=A0AAV1CUC5_OLDCO|nr:OLC1v1035813C1 [Oldenlandia corymbosa var. corymbosa]
MSSTSFQDWYIVKRNLNSGAKKIVEAYGGSAIWKPNFLYVKAREKYFVAWNYQETHGFEVIKDDWMDGDKEKIKEFDKDLMKFEKYSKIVKWEEVVQHFIPAIPTEEKEVEITLETPVEEKKGTNLVLLLFLSLGYVIEQCCFSTMSAASMAHLMHLSKLRNELVQAWAKRDQALIEKVTLEEKSQKIEAMEQELASVQARISTNGIVAAIEEVNIAATKYGAHKVAVAGLERLNGDRPIKAKWLKQFLRESPKKTMHEALENVLTKLNIEQLPLLKSLCGALAKVRTPKEITTFPGDLATVLSKGPSEEEPVPEVLDEYMGIELEDADDEASEEDVVDTGHSGAQKNAREASQSLPKDNSSGQAAV